MNTMSKENLERIKQYYLDDPYEKNGLQMILGYLLIPIWLVMLVCTTILLGLMFVFSKISMSSTKKIAEPFFKVRSIFPEDKEITSERS